MEVQIFGKNLIHHLCWVWSSELIVRQIIGGDGENIEMTNIDVELYLKISDILEHSLDMCFVYLVAFAN